MKKKTLEQLEQEIADRKAKARSESEMRQEKIKQFWDLKEQDIKAEIYEERKLKGKDLKAEISYEDKKRKERKLKDQKLKTLRLCISELSESNELTKIVQELFALFKNVPQWSELCSRLEELIELADLQDREIEYLTQFPRDWERICHYYPGQLQYMSSASSVAEILPYIEKQLAGQKPSQAWERKGRRSRDGWVNSIEYQFGGEGEAAWREAPWRKLPFYGGLDQSYKPPCLRKVLTGTPINMRELQDLFWPLGRERLSKYLPSPRRTGREVFYDHPAVPMLIKGLLEEKAVKRKRAQGKARRIWLGDPAVRIRVLSAVEAFIKSLANELWKAHPAKAQEWQTKIADPILAVLHPYLSDSAK